MLVFTAYHTTVKAPRHRIPEDDTAALALEDKVREAFEKATEGFRNLLAEIDPALVVETEEA
jgi:hypothetical protein